MLTYCGIGVIFSGILFLWCEGVEPRDSRHWTRYMGAGVFWPVFALLIALDFAALFWDTE